MRMPVVVKYTAMKPHVALPSVRVSAIDSRSESGISSVVVLLLGLGDPAAPGCRDQSRSMRVTPAVVV